MSGGKSEELVVKEIMIEIKTLISKNPVSVLVSFDHNGKVKVLAVGLNDKLQKIATEMAKDIVVFTQESINNMNLPKGIVGET